jgi:hypothetical protein
MRKVLRELWSFGGHCCVAIEGTVAVVGTTAIGMAVSAEVMDIGIDLAVMFVLLATASAVLFWAARVE